METRRVIATIADADPARSWPDSMIVADITQPDVLIWIIYGRHIEMSGCGGGAIPPAGRANERSAMSHLARMV